LNFVLDNAEAIAIVQRLLDAVVPGSYLALSHPTLELGGEGNAEAMRFWNEHARPPIRARGSAEIRQFLTGLDLVDPGLVSCALWRPDAPPPPSRTTGLPPSNRSHNRHGGRGAAFPPVGGQASTENPGT
jgi:S-adenosyl methyltransferase